MKDYLQPAATFALALAIASLGFTLPQLADAQGLSYFDGHKNRPIHIKCVSGCR